MVADNGAGPDEFRPTKPSLVDIPVSYNGARCRFIIYKEKLEEKIDVISPKEVGGLKSPQYLALNKQGKCPALIVPQPGGKPLCIAESEIVALYLLEKYAPHSKLLPSTPELRAQARAAARVVDVYMTPIQGCLYKPMDISSRATNVQELSHQLDVLESVVIGPYVLGDTMSAGDAAIFPTLTWLRSILPRVFGWNDVFADRPKLRSYWDAMAADPAAQRVIKELEDGLEAWHEKDRWAEVGIREHLADKSFNWALS